MILVVVFAQHVQVRQVAADGTFVLVVLAAGVMLLVVFCVCTCCANCCRHGAEGDCEGDCAEGGAVLQQNRVLQGVATP